ncbi:MAG: hypothetical protein A3A90_01270 [Candidatus Zambryskibacteria bacterium RIFCSPLOWO2_01_FULL_35_19]|uniref:NlpC/P60 domain-containing protein n=1 Tax=Candidatus Zambryskibacteria bacterium RIFCSPLOWO2_01_FULL_35_19 TaxID=1802757 RepID=A0A1G2TW03_9BACT|nr:MAG: hypothetical protein UU61_C0013G0002 [Parcubacteria group bacterium GW2011_GWB1_41_4]OHA87408.1 MAG: hypothetical protein A2726_01410 [Candidatus Zambryskibacteria bacterium RIFCSPHIGHO2_01_FULL_35_32]OHB01461.1 MAG: hypothetical protein A3A90_01270 [Candidatus Zambryskibacteria bacterium RIFCSPLOWO2_01_FULL_35_19]
MKKDKKQKVTPLLKKTYITTIENSIGSKMFCNLYAKVNGKNIDITRGGDLSCAVFVSSILFLFKLIKERHATVSSTIKDLKQSGWIEIEKPKIGCVLVWEEKKFKSGEKHKHIGFYIGKEKAISNNTKLKYPTKHMWDKFDRRKVELILWNLKLK